MYCYCCSDALLVRAASPPPPPPSSCSTDEDKQFSVTVATNEPLGLRLSDKLEVLEFVADAQGRGRAVEASGLAEIGDRLVQVNDESLLDRSLADAVAALTAATLPKVLRFQTHDGRCLARPSAAALATDMHASQSLQTPAGLGNSMPVAAAAPVYDYLLLSLGDKASETTFFGVLSADGKPPSCSFHELEIAWPFDACSRLATNATGKYVLVPSMFGCPAHQKATFVQDAGASGVVFVQHEGTKPQQVRVPPELPQPLVLPLVMVARDSGERMIELISRANSLQTPRVRLVFSAACATTKFEVDPDDDPLAQSVQARIASARAGFLTVSLADSGASMSATTAAYEFLKPAAAATLPIGKHNLVVLDQTRAHPCAALVAVGAPPSQMLQDAIEGQWVATALETTCLLTTQLAFWTSLRVNGVVFADVAFPTTAHASAAALTTQPSSSKLLLTPFVIVSQDALASIQQRIRLANDDDAVAHIQVEFTGENALQHHWSDLAELTDPTNWPSTELGRDRLFHRVLKDHAAVRDVDTQHHLARNERYDALIRLYWRAQHFYLNRERKSRDSNDDVG